MIFKTPKLSQLDSEEMARPMALDLAALFNVMRDDILEILNKDTSPEQMIDEINKLFGE